MSDLQYTQLSGAFIRCTATWQRLSAGFYKAQRTHAGMGLTPKPVVSDDLIDIPGTIADEVFSDINGFMGLSEEYALYGLTHKRGYLFYGPPGSGKTCLGTMLARRFIQRLDGIVVYVEDDDDFVGSVDLLRAVEPGRPAMYVIEEADNVLDYTACLSILDGETSVAGAIFVAMTNHKERLPPRISNRPGRFDRVIYVGAPPPGVQLEYVRRVAVRGMALAAADRIAGDIVTALDGVDLSLAHLREAFIAHHLMGLPLVQVRARFEEMAGAPAVAAEDDDDSDDDDCDNLCKAVRD